MPLAAIWPALRYDIGSGEFVDTFISHGDPTGTLAASSCSAVTCKNPRRILALTLDPREVWRYSQSNGKFADLVVPNPVNEGDIARRFALLWGRLKIFI